MFKILVLLLIGATVIVGQTLKINAPIIGSTSPNSQQVFQLKPGSSQSWSASFQQQQIAPPITSSWQSGIKGGPIVQTNGLWNENQLVNNAVASTYESVEPVQKTARYLQVPAAQQPIAINFDSVSSPYLSSSTFQQHQLSGTPFSLGTVNNIGGGAGGLLGYASQSGANTQLNGLSGANYIAQEKNVAQVGQVVPIIVSLSGNEGGIHSSANLQANGANQFSTFGNVGQNSVRPLAAVSGIGASNINTQPIGFSTTGLAFGNGGATGLSAQTVGTPLLSVQTNQGGLSTGFGIGDQRQVSLQNSIGQNAGVGASNLGTTQGTSLSWQSGSSQGAVPLLLNGAVGQGINSQQIGFGAGQQIGFVQQPHITSLSAGLGGQSGSSIQGTTIATKFGVGQGVQGIPLVSLNNRGVSGFQAQQNGLAIAPSSIIPNGNLLAGQNIGLFGGSIKSGVNGGVSGSLSPAQVAAILGNTRTREEKSTKKASVNSK